VGHAPLLQGKSALFYNGHVFVPSIFVKVPSDCQCLNSQLCSDVYLLNCERYHEHGSEHSLFTGALSLCGTDTILQRETRQGAVGFEYFQLLNERFVCS